VGCGRGFPSIDGALELQRLRGIRADKIDGVRIGTYKPALDIACHARPTTVTEAEFSIPYVVATAWCTEASEWPRMDPSACRIRPPVRCWNEFAWLSIRRSMRAFRAGRRPRPDVRRGPTTCAFASAITAQARPIQALT
jgi:hypothetical protein